jgi:threonine-phosphate decarboxylase
MPINLEHGGNIHAVARARGWDWREVLDFSASINPLGPSPKVREAIIGALDRVRHYPERHAERLRERLAEEWKVQPEQILTGNGATELIHFLARQPVFRRVGLVVPTYSEFHKAWPDAPSYQAELAGNADCDLMVYTNPNNPLGTACQIETKAWRLVDESFLEFTSLPTAMHEPRTLVLRSLTKFQALPGLRIGALVGPGDLMRKLYEFREPWAVNCLAEAACFAAIDDREHQQKTREYVSSERHWLIDALTSLSGARVTAGVANYLFVELDYPASELADFLMDRRILIRVCTHAPGISGQAVRIAVRRREENERLVDEWRKFIPTRAPISMEFAR